MGNVVWARFVMAAILCFANGCDAARRYWREHFHRSPVQVKHSLSPDRMMLRVGESQEFKLERIPEEGLPRDLTPEATWFSADPSVLVSHSADPGQKFTAAGPGVTSVRAEVDGQTYSASVVVVSPQAHRQGCLQVDFKNRRGEIGLTLSIDGSTASDGPHGFLVYSLVDQDMPVRLQNHTTCPYEIEFSAIPLSAADPAKTPERKLAALRMAGYPGARELMIHQSKLSRLQLRVRPRGGCEEGEGFSLKDSPARFLLRACGDL